MFGGVGHSVLKGKTGEIGGQTCSLTILTVVFGLGINRFLQFQGLFFLYLESFSLSKVFIIFGVGREGANTLARFL